jgi:ribA/ribD-fused uncharacterized protein
MNRADRLTADGYDPSIEAVLFYSPKNKHGYMSNYSNHSVTLIHPFTGKLVVYSTGEHRFQAMKATTLQEHEYVRTAASPDASKKRGREITLRDGWGNKYGDLCYYVMLETILAKATQSDYIRSMLKMTDDAPIYEDSPVDGVWGWRFEQDYRGKNLLGRCWMEIREIL